MRIRLIFVSLFATMFSLSAQEQDGIVKTIGRPGHPGEPLEEVLVRVTGTSVASVTDHEGRFSVVLAHYSPGQAYSLSRVYKNGYQLADADIIERPYPYSAEIPLEISMISKEEYQRIKDAIKADVRGRIEAEYQDRMSELRKQLEEKSISEDSYRQQLVDLLEYHDNTENLIEKLSDRYARTDYDRLDSLDARINLLIEQGRLDEAEKMIESKGTKEKLAKIRENNRMLAQTLEQGLKSEAEYRDMRARELTQAVDIASMRFDNRAAAGYLKERMELDTANVDWTMDYAAFIRDYLGHYEEAMALYRNLLRKSSDVHLTARLHSSIGNVYESDGRYDDALKSYLTSVELKESASVSGKSLASGYVAVASMYVRKNQYTDAEGYLAKAEKIYEECQDMKGIASIYALKAHVSHDFGKYSDAEDFFLKSMEIRKSLLGEQNFTMISLYSNFSTLLKKAGKYDEALLYINKALELGKKVLGENHSMVADAYLTLGSIEVESGKYDNALNYYETALSILQDYYGDIHPKKAEAYNKMGFYYSTVRNDLQKAKHYYSVSADMLERIYGHVHADVALSLRNLGVVYAHAADYSKALELYQEALEIDLALYGDGHVTIADSYNNIANVYYRIGRYDESLQCFENILRIYLNCFGESHPNTALAYHNLGSIYKESGDMDRALENLEKAAAIYKEAYGDSHPRLGTTYDSIGCLYFDEKDYDKAEEFLLEGLRIRINAYGEGHGDVAVSYNNLSQLYQEQGEFVKAGEMLLKSLDVSRRIYGENHPKIVTAYSNLSVHYRKQQKYDEAIEYVRRAIAVAGHCYESSHPHLVLNSYLLSILYDETGRYEEALPLMKTVYETAYAADGPKDRNVGSYFRYLYNLYFKVMAGASYDGGYDKEFEALSRTTVMVARVVPGSPAEQMGLGGEYYVASYEEWTLEDDKTHFFIYNKSVSSRPEKTYVFYRDGEFVPVSFRDRLGINLYPERISSEDKEALVKSFRKWHKKHRK